MAVNRYLTLSFISTLLFSLPAIAKSESFTQTGKASWYGSAFHGKKTANGERFNMNQLTAAHRTLPFASLVKVTNLNNGKSVVVRINDRGPFHGNRILDVSQAAAKLLGFQSQGTAKVKIEPYRKEQQETPI